jgi:DnaJ-class molecular chaperone
MIVHWRRMGATTVEGIVLVLILIGVGYVASLYLNPYVTCTKCQGKSMSKGWVFNYSHHICSRCQGTGQQPRWGTRFLKKGPQKPSSS